MSSNMFFLLFLIQFFPTDGGIQNPLTFSSALGTRYMPTENVSLSDLIGVVDMTLSCLVTWLEGHSLAQTVFTNLYLHAPQLASVFFSILLDLSFVMNYNTYKCLMPKGR